MSNFSCNICDVRCTGLEPYTQHLGSEKHRKKEIQVRASKSMNLNHFGHEQVLPLKAVDDTKNSPLLRNSANGEYKEQELFQNNFPMSDSNSMPNYRCDVCDVRCSGPEPYKQHLASDKHKKKEFQAQWSIRRNIMKTSPISKEVICNNVNVPVTHTSFPDVQNHIPESKNVCQETGTDEVDFLTSAVSFNASTQSSAFKLAQSTVNEMCVDEYSHILHLVKNFSSPDVECFDHEQIPPPVSSSLTKNVFIGDDKGPELFKNSKRKGISNFSCYVCDLWCNSTEQYEQHIISEKHKKKVLQSHFNTTKIMPASKKLNYDNIDSWVTNASSPYFQNTIPQREVVEQESMEIDMEPEKKTNEVDLHYTDEQSSLSTFSPSVEVSTNEIVKLLVNAVDEKYKETKLFQNMSFSDSVSSDFQNTFPKSIHLDEEKKLNQVDFSCQRISSKSAELSAEFKCLPCDKIFTGYVPFEAHINSVKHKKRMTDGRFDFSTDSAFLEMSVNDESLNNFDPKSEYTFLEPNEKVFFPFTPNKNA